MEELELPEIVFAESISEPNSSSSSEENSIPSQSDNNELSRGRLWISTDLGFDIVGLAKPQNPDLFDLYVQEVDSSSIAFQRGLRNKDEIMKIDGEIVHSASELKDYFNELGVSTNKSLYNFMSKERTIVHNTSISH